MAKKERTQHIQVYTDGAFDWNRKVGGYGAVIFMKVEGVNRMKKYHSASAYVDTTANRMELRAILAALKRITRGPFSIDIYTDSQYCELMVNKLFNHYTNIRSFKNSDLLKAIRKEIIRNQKMGSRITINWVRAHAGNPFNEMADKLANEGLKCEHKKVCQQTKNSVTTE